VRTVERARAGQPIGKTARGLLTDHAIKHARAELQAAGIPRPSDHEALLATYLNHQQNAPGPAPRLCACGCGQPVKHGRRGPAGKWHSDACRKRATRASNKPARVLPRVRSN
jgi:hypothetical protein